MTKNIKASAAPYESIIKEWLRLWTAWLRGMGVTCRFSALMGFTSLKKSILAYFIHDVLSHRLKAHLVVSARANNP